MKDWVQGLFFVEVVIIAAALSVGGWSLMTHYEDDARVARIVTIVLFAAAIIGGIVLYLNVPPGTFPGW